MTASQEGGQPSVRYCSVLTHGVMSMAAACHAPIRTLRCGPSFDCITGKGGAKILKRQYGESKWCVRTRFDDAK